MIGNPMRDLINLVTNNSVVMEARRWQKPRLSDIVAHYIDDPMVFVHFAPIPKMGINPGYSYEHTPAGIYAYPITVMRDRFGKPAKYVPDMFASDNPYLFVFRVAPGARVMEVSEYDGARFDADFKALRSRFGKGVVETALQTAMTRRGQAPFETMYRMTNALARRRPQDHAAGTRWPPPSHTAIGWAAMLRSLGHEGFIDRGDHMLTHDIGRQAVFFTKQATSVLEMIDTRIGTRR